MKVTVKLFASLRDRLPAGTSWHGVALEVPADVTPYQLIDQFHVPRELAHLVLHNGVYLEPTRRDQAVLREGDVLAIWPPIAGG